MQEYHKIQSIFKRDDRGQFIDEDFALPEFEYLKDSFWIWDEKIDGTNIRIGFDGYDYKIGGRTDNSQIPTFLYDKLNKIFTVEKLSKVFTFEESSDVVLYGEGYGAKIQKGGNYIPDGVDFVLFDVRVGDYWLRRDSVFEIAQSLNIKSAPIVGGGTLSEAINFIKSKTFKSTWGDFLAEGIVLRPKVDLCTRMGRRIITKLKHKDFRD